MINKYKKLKEELTVAIENKKNTTITKLMICQN